jgi:hypothetical protein
MHDWKLTRVRSDCFSNKSAITRPGSSGSRIPARNFAFKSAVSAKMRLISLVVKSATFSRCRMARLFSLWGQQPTL